MRPQKVKQKDLLEAMMVVFQNKGYDGASLNELAEASGLKKASLYHRFPGGKKDIGAAVFDYVMDDMDATVYQQMVGDDVPNESRVNAVVKGIKKFYGAGKSTCLIRAFSMDSGMQLFEELINTAMKKWLDGFKTMAKHLGFDEAESGFKAEQAIIQIQGSLVLSKALSTTEPFETALMKVSVMFMK